jgi:hypothetical protein
VYISSIIEHSPAADLGSSEAPLSWRGERVAATQRLQRYGVVVDIRIRPERSRIGREYSVESLWMSVLPRRSADLARAAVRAR